MSAQYLLKSKEGGVRPYEAVPLENTQGSVRLTALGSTTVPRASAETFEDSLASGPAADPEPAAPSRFTMPDGSTARVLGCVGIIVAIAVLLVLILVPMSFSGVEYDSMAFRKRRTTGSVDLSRVYEAGLHFIGPDYEFKTFPAIAHFEELSHMSVFNADRLEIRVTARLQYFLRPHQLHLLHKKFDIHYRPVVRKNAMDAVKGAATVFTNREMILERNRIEKALFKAVKERLGGRCCEKDCATNGKCVRGCKSYDTCTEADYGLFSEVRYFQLLEVTVPSGINERYLDALVLQEQNEREMLNQKAVIIRKGTDQLVKQTENAAAEINQGAVANASLVSSKASAEAKSSVENARSEGLKSLYSELGIRTTEQKMAFDYLRTLRKQGKVKLAVDYQTYISGPYAGEL